MKGSPILSVVEPTSAAPRPTGRRSSPSPPGAWRAMVSAGRWAIPRVWLEMGEADFVECPYCDRQVSSTTAAGHERPESERLAPGVYEGPSGAQAPPASLERLEALAWLARGASRKEEEALLKIKQLVLPLAAVVLMAGCADYGVGYYGGGGPTELQAGGRHRIRWLLRRLLWSDLRRGYWQRRCVLSTAAAVARQLAQG